MSSRLTAVTGRVASLLLTLPSLLYGAEELRPVTVARVGYIRADADPECNSCTDWNPESTGVAWDYGNRSLVVDLSGPRCVTRIVVVSDIKSAPETKLKADTLSLYASMDNQQYVRYKQPYTVRIEHSEEPGKVWRVEFAGLKLFARYVKLKQTYNGADYGFGMNRLKEAVRVWAADTYEGPVSIDALIVDPAQTRGRVTAHSLVKAPRQKGFSLRLEVQNTETWESFSRDVPFQPETWTSTTIKSPKLMEGGYWITARLRYKDMPVTEVKAAFRVHETALTDTDLSHGSLSPGAALVLRDLPLWCEGGQAFTYSLPHAPKEMKRGVVVPKGGQVTLRVPVSGECAVYVAVDNPWPELSAQWGEAHVSIPPTQDDWEPTSDVQELFVGYGDFSANPIILRSPNAPCRLSHLRVARPTSEEAVLAHHQNDPTHNRRVIYNNDGFTELWGVKDWDRSRLLQLVERYQGTDTEIFEMASLVSGWVNYPSKYASFYRPGDVPDDQWVRENDKMAVDLFNQLERDGLSIFPTLSARGRELGIHVWGSLRMSGYYGFQERQTMQPFNGKLWHEHPEMRIRNRDGSCSAPMSFAWEAVRQQRIGVLGELAEMGCEGVMMDFCRYPDILGYDEPLLNGFKAKHGVSPLDLPGEDERWIKYRCEVMNDFFRAVRKRIDDIGRKQGRKLGISVRVPAAGYRKYGFDPQTWARERLMDIFIPHFPGLESDFDVRPWVAMAKGTGIKVYPGIEVTKSQTSNTELTDAEIKRGVKPGIETTMTKNDYRRKVWRRYRQGAEGVFLFNIWTIGETKSLLGDKQSLKKWSYFEDPMNLPREWIVRR